ncbi:BgTH12-07484 [Blumeria graminis f. sp. triticale]|nr:BgTH12-07484 [Blumeria graminis f. sp. triticale]
MRFLMKWLKRKKKSSRAANSDGLLSRPNHYQQMENGFSYPKSCTYIQLPQQVLERIFSFVCPHTQDETYESCESSAHSEACMLCNLRDLAHCARACRKWEEAVHNVLYHSIRIDQVHYCEREAILAEKRKRKSFMSRNAEPEDTAQARLRLLSRTLREDRRGVSSKVLYLKVPYQTRETCQADLARTISVLPNLRYVDLPEGVFTTGDTSCDTLRFEVQARCPDLRKMSYFMGAEKSFEMLVGGNVWCNLEVLEISRLNLDPITLRLALASLPRLRALKVTHVNSFDNSVLSQNDQLPMLPPLTELILDQTPLLTYEGIISYLSDFKARQALKTLSMTGTGVAPTTLHVILALSENLEHLGMTEAVSTSLSSGLPCLKSTSLKILHFEITAADEAMKLSELMASYYSYLRSSLMSEGLPNLRELYVLDPSFPETLLDFPLPKPSFAYDRDSFVPNHRKNASQSSNPFLNTNRQLSPEYPYGSSPKASTISLFPAVLSPPLTPSLPRALEVYSKGLDEMEWNFSRVSSLAGSGRANSALPPRPTSSYGLSDGADRAWAGAGNDVRRSIIIGNGFGNFLAVPGAGGMSRPRTSASDHF